MKPIPIPDELMPPDTKRATVGAPRGREDKITPIEVWQGFAADGTPVQGVLVELSDEDLTAIAQKPLIWLMFLSKNIVPFSFTPVASA